MVFVTTRHKLDSTAPYFGVSILPTELPPSVDFFFSYSLTFYRTLTFCGLPYRSPKTGVAYNSFFNSLVVHKLNI